MITGKEDLLQALVEAYIMEKGTREFYADAAAKAAHAEAKNAFDELTRWEARHMAYIQSLYQSVLDDRELEEFRSFSASVPAPLAEGGMPVKDLEKRIERHVIRDEKDALSLALVIEARSHKLYKDLAAAAQDREARVIFEEMMAQETKHLERLHSMKKAVS